MLGCDNFGRGDLLEGHGHYVDPYRIHQWYHAPGNDFPGGRRGQAIRGFKTHASAIHGMPARRVWCEAFYGAGWGMRPEEVLAGFNEAVSVGATLLNLHGLYYSTFGSWWEWASPDLHWRQPYWRHLAPFAARVARLCQAMSSGEAEQQIALLYPLATVIARTADRTLTDEFHALGTALLDAGHDYAVLHDEAFAEALAVSQAGGRPRARVRGRDFAAIVVPPMAVLRRSTADALHRLAAAGVAVLWCGERPRHSDEAWEDPHLDGLLDPSAGHRWMGDAAETVAAIHDLGLDPPPPAEPSRRVRAITRRLDDGRIRFVYNHGDDPVDVACDGPIDLDTGRAGPSGRVTLLPGAAVLDLIPGTRSEPVKRTIATADRDDVESVPLLGPWHRRLIPTIDNRFGDFELPAAPGSLLGPTVRQVRCCPHSLPPDDWMSPAFDDSSWPTWTCSFGPRAMVIGDLDPSRADRLLAALTRRPEDLATLARPYPISLRWGIERDPFLTNVLSGPHGLKGRVPDDWIDLGDHAEPGRQWIVAFWTSASSPGKHVVVAGSRSRFDLWGGRRRLVSKREEDPPGVHPMWNLPHYETTPRTAAVELSSTPTLMVMRLTQPRGQRLRAHVGFTSAGSPSPLHLRWFCNSHDPRPMAFPQRGSRLQQFRFHLPAGAAGFQVAVAGSVTGCWIDGRSTSASTVGRHEGGITRYAFTCRSVDAQALLALEVLAPPGSAGADCIREWIRPQGPCPSITRLGDWREEGLQTFSGCCEYATSFTLSSLHGRRATLDLGNVACTAAVRINDRPIGVRVAPPWRFELGGHLVAGRNILRVEVCNTLANHYSVGIPTPYAFEPQGRSGLLGPVFLHLHR